MSHELRPPLLFSFLIVDGFCAAFGQTPAALACGTSGRGDVHLRAWADKCGRPNVSITWPIQSRRSDCARVANQRLLIPISVKEVENGWQH
jgi:hypothetical protein